MNIESTWSLPYSPEKVYAAWVSNDTVIPPAVRMDIKPEVGGHYRLHAAGDGFTMSNEGKFLIVEPNAHLRYTWQWQDDPEVTEVDVQFGVDPNNPDGTHLLLRHGVFLTQESQTNHNNGWNSYVAGLSDLLGQSG